MKNATATVLGVSSSAAGVKKAADIVAALAPPSKKDAMVPAGESKSVVTEAKKFAPGLVGAAAGYYVGGKKHHPILGALVGHALGDNAKDLYDGDRKRAACNVAVEVAGVVGALKYKKHPVVGYVVGALAGAVATYFAYDGSAARDAYNKLRNR